MSAILVLNPLRRIGKFTYTHTATRFFGPTAPATLRELLKAVTTWGREAVLIRMLGPHAQRLQLYLPPFDAIFGESDAQCLRV